MFQHTAARRRLGGEPLDWAGAFGVSTHSRPKAAGQCRHFGSSLNFGFNTQPPEGGWICIKGRL